MNQSERFISYLFICFFLIIFENAQAEGFYDVRELGGGYSEIDLNFDIPPGYYYVNVKVNKNNVYHDTYVEFVSTSDGTKVKMNKVLFDLIGVDLELAPKLASDLSHFGYITDIERYLSPSYVEVNYDTLDLQISIPQYYLKKDDSQFKKLNFDQGENLVFSTYDVRGFSIGGKNSINANLTAGLNLHGWSLRHEGAYLGSNTDNSTYNAYSTYLERPLAKSKSKLRLGTAFSSQNNSSFNFTGLSLKSEERMLSRENRGYAPTIKGIADTNATVEIFQNNSLIYRELVSPGMFEIDNLRDTGSSGDLTVFIIEENGERKEFLRPYANTQDMLREGMLTYQVDIGQHREVHSSEGLFFNGHIRYGLSEHVTGTMGTLISGNYWSYVTGLDVSLNQFGNLSLDYELGVEGTEGYTLSTTYTKDFSSTGTNISLSNLVYEADDWFTFDEYIIWLNQNAISTPGTDRKTRQGISLTQSLGFGLSASLSGYKETYRNSNETYNMNLSTSKSFKHLTGSFTYNEIKGNNFNKDRQFVVSLNIPLDFNKGRDFITSTYRLNDDGEGVTTLGYSGKALKDSQLRYNINLINDKNSSQGSINAEYRGSKGIVKAGYTKNENSESYNYGLSGTVVGIEDALILTQPIYDTFAIIDTGVEGIGVRSKPGIVTDSNGYAVVDYLTPYETSQIVLDTYQVPGLNIDSTLYQVKAMEGAGVRAKFHARKGIDLLIRAEYEGKPIPFGTMITVNGHLDTSVFGDDGVIYISGAPLEGSINVYHNGVGSPPCVIEYQRLENDFQDLNLECIDYEK
ncbi:fimbrial biogenesis outer membrane usher protein [Vibrio parahaemolyticus]|nr:fimbrial biogenesis outer membrane usher protein [Vibrio parahaemolyticus]ELB2164005.1 fimbrial biogenesis outer membrane usher protein [Vibrio parahaemolyticus]ELB2187455.1 fimbrial biogenesis outer membrane usher protein [Vibrio parahaemolyticus]ELB2192426.1 fimbrial biogenesis outer membrane usher protein [Vibrio parahaemolyticus]ELB2212587.1 fimbrial biogenesis outer membrane usher protein [Vibrio parahaemolyticus]